MANKKLKIIQKQEISKAIDVLSREYWNGIKKKKKNENKRNLILQIELKNDEKCEEKIN